MCGALCTREQRTAHVTACHRLTYGLAAEEAASRRPLESDEAALWPLMARKEPKECAEARRRLASRQATQQKSRRHADPEGKVAADATHASASAVPPPPSPSPSPLAAAVPATTTAAAAAPQGGPAKGGKGGKADKPQKLTPAQRRARVSRGNCGAVSPPPPSREALGRHRPAAHNRARPARRCLRPLASRAPRQRRAPRHRRSPVQRGRGERQSGRDAPRRERTRRPDAVLSPMAGQRRRHAVTANNSVAAIASSAAAAQRVVCRWWCQRCRGGWPYGRHAVSADELAARACRGRTGGQGRAFSIILLLLLLALLRRSSGCFISIKEQFRCDTLLPKPRRHASCGFASRGGAR
jgi:hypothetical protein